MTNVISNVPISFVKMDAFQRIGGRSCKDAASKIMLTLADRSVLEHFSRTGKAPNTKMALPENVTYLVKCMLLLLLLSRFNLFYKQYIDSVG